MSMVSPFPRIYYGRPAEKLIFSLPGTIAFRILTADFGAARAAHPRSPAERAEK